MMFQCMRDWISINATIFLPSWLGFNSHPSWLSCKMAIIDAFLVAVHYTFGKFSKRNGHSPRIVPPPLLGTPCMASQIESNIRRKVLGWSTKGWIAILGSANWVIHFNSYGHSSQRCALRFTVTLQQHIHCNSYGHSQKRMSLILANHQLGHMCGELIWRTIT